jgi:hypothetical protein
MTMRELRLRTAGVAPRIEQMHGREHLVVPVVALMEGVIHAVNSEVPEYVTPQFLTMAAQTFDGRPCVLGHPTLNGVQISANDPRIANESQFGTVYKSKIAGSKLMMEAWIDPQKLEALGEHEMLKDLRAGKPIEVSVGANVHTAQTPGTYNGKKYDAKWMAGIGDHLAFLPHGIGACSVAMGCGACRAAEAVPAYEIDDSGYRELGREAHMANDTQRNLGGPGSGWTAEGGHVPGSQGGSGGSGSGSGNKNEAAAAAHENAANAHTAAGDAMDTVRSRGYDPSHGAGLPSAQQLSKEAHQASQQTNFGKKDLGNSRQAVGNAARGNYTASMRQHYAMADQHMAAARAIRAGTRSASSKSSLSGRLSKFINTLRAAALFDTPEQAASEEAAELVGYQALRSQLDAMGKAWDDASGIVDDLIADETEDPTETPAQEDAEEEVEGARLDALQSLLGTIVATAYSAQNLCMSLNMPDLPSPTDPRYGEALRAAAGKTISAKTMQAIQTMHDASHTAHNQATALGAECNGMRLLSKHSEESTMTKEEKGALIKSLTECSCSGFVPTDIKTLEAMSDDQLTRIKAKTDASVKANDDLKVAEAKFKAAEEKAKEQPKELTEAEVLVKFPSIKTLVDRAQATEAARKTELVTQLKTAQSAYNEDELKALELSTLEKLAVVAKIGTGTADYSGRGLAAMRTASDGNDLASFAPPDPYDKALKNRAANQKVN